MITEDGPGIESTGIFSFIHSLTNLNPGSAISGVPASETSAICLPFLRLSMICGNALGSLKSFKTIMGFLMSRWFNNMLVRRVSSQITISTCLSVSMALRVISLRLPIGVATI